MRLKYLKVGEEDWFRAIVPVKYTKSGKYLFVIENGSVQKGSSRWGPSLGTLASGHLGCYSIEEGDYSLRGIDHVNASAMQLLLPPPNFLKH